MGFGKEGKGEIITEVRSQALGTLATATALLIGTKLATLEDFRILRSEIYAVITGVTAGEFEGLLFGLAEGSLTVGELEQAIEANGPLGPNEVAEGERTSRFVKLIGAVTHPTDSEVTIVDGETNAPMIVVKPRWSFAATSSWNWFVYNNGVAPTTGATVKIAVKNFGVWVR